MSYIPARSSTGGGPDQAVKFSEKTGASEIQFPTSPSHAIADLQKLSKNGSYIGLTESARRRSMKVEQLARNFEQAAAHDPLSSPPRSALRRAQTASLISSPNNSTPNLGSGGKKVAALINERRPSQELRETIGSVFASPSLSFGNKPESINAAIRKPTAAGGSEIIAPSSLRSTAIAPTSTELKKEKKEKREKKEKKSRRLSTRFDASSTSAILTVSTLSS